MESATQSVSKQASGPDAIISTLVVLFLLFDAVAKLMRIAPVLAAFTQLGFSTSVAVPIGAVLLVCTILYVIPPTSILGAILLAAYLGGATVTHLRAGQPFYFPIIFGVLVWGGLYLRESGCTPHPAAKSQRALASAMNAYAHQWSFLSRAAWSQVRHPGTQPIDDGTQKIFSRGSKRPAKISK